MLFSICHLFHSDPQPFNLGGDLSHRPSSHNPPQASTLGNLLVPLAMTHSTSSAPQFLKAFSPLHLSILLREPSNLVLGLSHVVSQQ